MSRDVLTIRIAVVMAAALVLYAVKVILGNSLAIESVPGDVIFTAPREYFWSIGVLLGASLAAWATLGNITRKCQQVGSRATG